MVARRASKRLGELFSLAEAVVLGRPNLSLDNPRQDLSLRQRVVLVCELDDEVVQGELLDISATGMRILLKTFVELNETVRVSAPDQSGLVARQSLIYRVKWVHPRRPEYEVGLEYNDSDENLARSWIQLALRHLDLEQVKPRSRSIPAYLFVQVSGSHNLVSGRGICVNIGTGGCLLQTERQIPREAVVKLGLGPSDLEASIFISGRVLNHIPSIEFGQFLHHVEFFPGENHNHSRLRSLLLTLLQELERETLVSEDPRVKPEGRVSPRDDSGPAKRDHVLSELLGRQMPLNTRNYELRSTSLWAARNLPVGRRRSQPQDSQRFHEPSSQDPDNPPLDRDYLS